MRTNGVPMTVWVRSVGQEDAEGQSDEERLAAWQRALEELLTPVTVAPRGRLQGTVTTHRLGYLQASSVQATPQKVSRPARLCHGTARQRFALLHQHTGAASLTHAGHQLLLAEGHLTVIDLKRPFSLDFPHPFGAGFFQLPSRVLGHPGPVLAELPGREMSSDGGPGAALALLLTELAHSGTDLHPDAAPRVAGHVAGLVDAAVLHGRRQRPDVSPGDELLARAHEFVAAHLEDPDLGPEMVAAALRISVRYLHRLFENEELTVSRLIQVRRVEACARSFSRRGRSSPTVSAVAQRYGFVNAAHFSRAFRAVYGVSPRVWRDTAGAGVSAARPAPAAPRTVISVAETGAGAGTGQGPVPRTSGRYTPKRPVT
ncbi:helix-turn-helix domain-containing protein [Streptomyces sp. NPDC007084]|uniref:helix-turn-helix domain-containing protein n=1 Tax=Streptomyces sp. NPDC007084 TaxID=3154313 RepID=UPI0034524536